MVNSSERKTAEQLKQRSDHLYRLLADNVTDIVWTTDLEMRVTYVSPSIKAHLGCTSEEVLGVSASAYLVGDSARRIRAALSDELARERAGERDPSRSVTIELEYRRKDGSTLWGEFKMRLLHDGVGRTVGVLGVTRDISKRRRVEQALVESERLHRLLVDHVSDIVWTTDMALRPTYVSPSITAHLGYSVEEMLSLSPAAYLTTKSFEAATKVLEQELACDLTGGHPANWSRLLELEFHRKDGSTMRAELRWSFLRDPAGRAIGLIGITRDVTERQRLEEMRADFVALTTHQLRTPLTGILWLLELAEGTAIGEESRAYIRDARESADRLVEMINNLLDSAHLEGGSLNVVREPVSLPVITRRVLDELRPLIDERRLHVSVAGAETVGRTIADPKLLREVVLNLVSNAVKYTPPGGTITIRMDWSEREVRWEIEDSGIGIPKTARGRLFEKFYRAENASTIAPEGTGLGLYLARLIVERFGGQIEYESEEGKGAVFRFTLPAGG